MQRRRELALSDKMAAGGASHAGSVRGRRSQRLADCSVDGQEVTSPRATERHVLLKADKV